MDGLVRLLLGETTYSMTEEVSIDLLLCCLQEPWKSQNKMTARTLGIACGLSIFPNLEPSKATNLLEHLVRNSSKIQQSHSLL